MRTKHASSAVDAVVTRMLSRSDPEPEASTDSDLTIAAEEILAAVKANDAAALAEAIRSAVALCDLGNYEPERGE
jgi:hypothetical protein